MEPRSIERGEIDQIVSELQGPLASMEPRSIERGELFPVDEMEDTTELQWSHVQSNVERFCKERCNAKYSLASMEPRSIERGEKSR